MAGSWFNRKKPERRNYELATTQDELHIAAKLMDEKRAKFEALLNAELEKALNYVKHPDAERD